MDGVLWTPFPFSHIVPAHLHTVPGWTSELPSTHGNRQMLYRSVDEREYHDAVSQGEGLGELSRQRGDEDGEQHQQQQAAGAHEVGPAGQPAAAPAPKGLPGLPPKPAARQQPHDAGNPAAEKGEAAGKNA